MPLKSLMKKKKTATKAKTKSRVTKKPARAMAKRKTSKKC